jgi:putative membrane protein
VFRSGVFAAVVVALSASPVLADSGARVTPDRVWQAWSFDPLVLFSLTLLGWLYGRGAWQLRSKSRSKLAIQPIHIAAFYASLATIALALLSPLDALSQELSSAHMIQHTLLMIVAAPLFVLGGPMRAFARSIPPAWRQISGLRWLSHRLTWQP